MTICANDSLECRCQESPIVLSSDGKMIAIVKGGYNVSVKNMITNKVIISHDFNVSQMMTEYDATVNFAFSDDNKKFTVDATVNFAFSDHNKKFAVLNSFRKHLVFHLSENENGPVRSEEDDYNHNFDEDHKHEIAPAPFISATLLCQYVRW